MKNKNNTALVEVPRRRRNYFNLKSKCSRLFAANVLYKFTCSNDSSITYLGETKRQLFKRISDHKGTDKKSAVLQHLQDCIRCQNSDISKCFEIVQRCLAKTICSTEALLIAKHCPTPSWVRQKELWFP